MVKPHWTRVSTKRYGARMNQEQDPRKSMGSRLQVARQAKGKTQTEVGNHFGVKKGTVSAWETGGGIPDALTLRELCNLYDISADAILWGDEPSPSIAHMSPELAQFVDRFQKIRDAHVRVLILNPARFAVDLELESQSQTAEAPQGTKPGRAAG